MSVTKETFTNDNTFNPSLCHVYFTNVKDARVKNNVWFSNDSKYWIEIPFVKYQIKETDLRRKTATLTTTHKFDQTQALYVIKFVSAIHENFGGYLLSTEYTKNSDGTYNYMCQDFSRNYQSKIRVATTGNTSLYRLLKSLLTNMVLNQNAKLTSAIKKQYKTLWSGLRPLAQYQPSLWGNPIKTNMLGQDPRFIAQDTSIMDIILDICHANAYVDVYFDSRGVLQIEPISMKDWQNTGLILTGQDIAGDSKYKFDIKNAITSVYIKGIDDTKAGSTLNSKSLIGLDLTAIFGNVMGTVKNANSSNTSSKSTKSVKQATVKDNPYNTKRKYLLIDADGGETVSFLNEIAKYIRNAGWTVDIDTNIGPGAHSRNYKKIKNGCYMNVYNGLCADTIAEMAYSYYGGVIKKNGSVHCPAWDTRTWNERNKPYKYSIEKLKNLGTAHDWNRGSTVGNLKTPAQYMAKNGIKYCLAPSAKGIANQFLAGGFRAYNGIK